MDSVHPHVGGEHEYLVGAVAEAVIGAVAREEPEGRGYLGIEKELGGQVDDAVHEVALLDHAAAHVAFAIGLAGEGALGEDDARLTARGEVEGEVLEPGEVGIAHGGHAVLPAGVLAELVAAPVAVVERGIGEDVVRADVLVGVVEEGAFAVPFDLRAVDGAYDKVHADQPPGGLVALLPEDGQVADAALMLAHEFLALHEHAAAARSWLAPRRCASFVNDDHTGQCRTGRLTEGFTASRESVSTRQE